MQETKVKDIILPALETLLAAFRGPSMLIKKRAAKLLDLDRVNELKAAKEPIEKAFLESADAYYSINDQLVEELPIFLKLISEYVQTLMCQAAEIQAHIYQLVWYNFAPVCESLNVDSFATPKDISKQYLASQMVGGSIERIASSICLMKKWHDIVWIDGEFVEAVKIPNRQPDSSLFGSCNSLSLPQQLAVQADVLSQSAYDAELSNAFDAFHIDARYLADPFEAVAAYDFAAEGADEMSLIAGEIVFVVATGGRADTDDGWWFGKSHETIGWFPATFVVVKIVKN